MNQTKIEPWKVKTMNHTKYFFAICLLVLAPGCAFNRQVVLDTAVGPPRLLAENHAAEGGLVVYSGYDVGGGGIDSDYSHHSDYKIYSLDGKLIKYLSNKVSAIMEDPATVSLPPGKYKVVAKAAGSGMVTVPVVIEQAKTTTVYLDGSGSHLKRMGAETNFVRLPDGSFVGWRATTEIKP